MKGQRAPKEQSNQIKLSFNLICCCSCGEQWNWLIAACCLWLWVMAAAAAMLRKEKTNQASNQFKDFSSFLFHQINSQSEIEFDWRREMEWGAAAKKPNNSWIKRRNKMNFISLIDEMNWVGYGRQRPSARREQLRNFAHSLALLLCLPAPRKEDKRTNHLLPRRGTPTPAPQQEWIEEK